MHVARSIPPTRPPTWAGRGPEALFARFDLRARAIAWYQSHREAPVLAAIRGFGSRWRARFDKGRSATQSPSAFERLLEDIVVLRAAGASTAKLRECGVEIHRLVRDLDGGTADAARLLAAMEAATAAELRANEVEIRLLCRAHRRLDETDIDEVIDVWRAELAAKAEALDIASAFRRTTRAARHGLRLVPSGTPGARA